MDKKITLRHLEAFRAIMVRKTVTGAAEKLGVSQPVVTKLLFELEKRIGIELFQRKKGKLTATPEAAFLLEDVHQALLRVERIANAADSIQSLHLPHLEIAAAPAIALSLLPQTIHRFSQVYSDTYISMHMHSSPTVLDMTQKERCDLGFVMLPMYTKRAQAEPLLTAKMMCAIPSHHRLSEKEFIVPEDFEGENFISHPSLLDVRTQIDSIFLAHKVRRKLHIETQISMAMIKLVEVGAGVSIIDALTACAYQSDLIKFIPFKPSIFTNYSILISPRRSSPLILKPFIDYAKEEVRRIIPTDLLYVE